MESTHAILALAALPNHPAGCVSAAGEAEPDGLAAGALSSVDLFRTGAGRRDMLVAKYGRRDHVCLALDQTRAEGCS